jgi:predicted cupin superfamily sugar epimerase
MSTERIQYLIEKLDLLPHPEGGFYKEVYRSEENITSIDRSLMTSIYFLITGSNVSRFHRIKSDELWFFHEGNPLIVHTLDENGHTENLLGLNLMIGEKPQLLVTKNTVFGSCLKEHGSYALVSCVVAPGFDFRDFELFDYGVLSNLYPNNELIIKKLT